MNTTFLKRLRSSIKPKQWDVTGFTQSKSHSVIYLFNESFRTGQFRSVWKIAKVTQPFKGGSPIDCDNYGPFSVLPCISKFMESFVNIDLRDFVHEGSVSSLNSINSPQKTVAWKFAIDDEVSLRFSSLLIV